MYDENIEDFKESDGHIVEEVINE